MTKGQSLALWQLYQVESADRHALEIEEYAEPTEQKPYLMVKLNLYLGRIPTSKDGLPLRERETFLLFIPPMFPLVKPEVRVGHDRFACYPHVQWVHYLCLYQSQTEWNAGDGMFGLLERLEKWLRQGALNQLDPEGQPLHPPAVYADVELGKLFVPIQDTPVVAGSFWLGLAQIGNHPGRTDIVGWYDLEHIPEQGEFAVAILFADVMPWEYPSKASEFFAQCERQGVSEELLYLLLQASSRATQPGNPIYLIFGSPMRGIAGGIRKQHLSVWAIPPGVADSVRLSIKRESDSTEISTVRDKLKDLMKTSIGESHIAWCRVLEARPEVTIRRDKYSPVAYFRNKSVAIWGCGAIGAHVALYLCRAGIRELHLVDSGTVTPGILVRQPFKNDDIGRPKVEALAKRLKEIRPGSDFEVDTSKFDIVESFETTGWESAEGVDLIFDATASDIVRRTIEMHWQRDTRPKIPVVSMMIDHSAKLLIAGIVGDNFSGGPWDVFRKTKIEVVQDSRLKTFADAFFPSEQKLKIFQPEPGCSEPTFIGSAADLAGLSAIGLNLVAEELRSLKADHAVTSLLLGSYTAGKAVDQGSKRIELCPEKSIRLTEYQVRISELALNEIEVWIKRNQRKRGKDVETGGLLWGQIDEVSETVWITDASGPPRDSKHKADEFICGKDGTEEEHNTRLKQTRHSVGYIGMWHTHPESSPLPSNTDIAGMSQVLINGPVPPSKNILLIAGSVEGDRAYGVYLFRKLYKNSGYALLSIDSGILQTKGA